ncbi:MAG TPA: VWA domain-containing protein [Vicinamibacterales bacterium]|nr:VWA domain-containing protein [Vicinamibacterales bacterium]
MRTIKGLAAAAVCLSGGAWLTAQQAPGQPPAFRSGVDLITVDVGVVDRQGNPVRELTAGDFVVTVGGQPRRIVTAEFVDTTALQPAALKADLAPVSSNEGGGVGRLVVFIVDQSTLEPGDARRVGTAAARFFDGLTFADRSALMLLPVGPNVPFTWAHDRVRAALQRATGLGGPSRTWEYGSLAEARDIANRHHFALRSVADRECRSSISASGSGLGGAAGTGPGSPGPVLPPTGGGAGGGGAAGGPGTGPAGEVAGGGGGGAPRAPRGGGASLAVDACTSSLQMQAEATWRMVEMTSMASVASLRQVLASLATVRGDKTIILVSGGWPMDLQEETSLLSTVAAEAASARATLFSVFVPSATYSADRRLVSTTPARDNFLYASALETLAGMTGGGSYRAEVGAEAAFNRLGRELGGYYRIGVERLPTDLTGRPQPMKVNVTRTAVTVRARELFDIRTYEDRDWAARLASALDSPIPASGIGLRVTSYLSAEPEDTSRVKVVLTGEATRLQPGDTTFQVVVRDLDGKKIVEGEPPVAEATTERMPFATHVPLEPGSYIVRIAVMDSAGQVGSVDHRIEVQPTRLGSFAATGPTLVRVPSGEGAEAQLALDAVLQEERLALELNLAGPGADAADTEVTFEIASGGDGPALVKARAGVARGSHEGFLVAQGVADMRVLPPGLYVARATVRKAGVEIGQMRRGFEVLTARPRITNATNAAAIVPSRSASAPALSRALLASVPRFTAEQALAPEALNPFLQRIAERSDTTSPALRELLDQARTSDLRTLAVSDVDVATMPAAAFVRGISLLAQNKLDPAADAFRAAMRTSADFYPAMVYLGACFAAGGNDRQAAGAWRTALIREADSLALQSWLIDAQLRTGSAEQALETIADARDQWPDDLGLQRRFAVASLLAGNYAEGLSVVDELVARQADDEATLLLALRSLYDAHSAGQPVESLEADRARMTRLAEAYRARGGASQALVDVWIAASLKQN